jgi:DNA-binding MarR family transcriptional regulator
LKTQVSPSSYALGHLIGAHAALTRTLSEELVAEHGLTIGEYEVLFLLARAEERSMRRVDIAGEVRLSASGVTRLLDRLEAAGLVEKGKCQTDARVTYAVLTDAGWTKLEQAWPTHVAGIERLIGEALDEDEIASLAELLGKLSDLDAASCGLPDPA